MGFSVWVLCKKGSDELETMPRNEPGGFHVVFLKQLEEAADADRAGEVATAWMDGLVN